MGNDTDLRDLFIELTWSRALNSRMPDEARARIAELLRGDPEIPRVIRDALADIFDDKAQSLYVAELKRRPGRPRKQKVDAGTIWDFVDERTSLGRKAEAAVADAMAHWGISRSTVEAARAKVNQVLAARPELAQKYDESRCERQIKHVIDRWGLSRIDVYLAITTKEAPKSRDPELEWLLGQIKMSKKML
ncbi:hypothetical protein [Methylocystis parvus]|uniref:hypothetical protein n=1 Tax=Methylocystis parvus TaxID=134 RepID=UPI003C70997B